MRVGRLGGRGEANPLVAVGELDVEEGHQGLKIKYIIIVLHLETDCGSAVGELGVEEGHQGLRKIDMNN